MKNTVIKVKSFKECFALLEILTNDTKAWPLFDLCMIVRLPHECEIVANGILDSELNKLREMAEKKIT